MILSNEALRSILPIAGWSDRQVAEVVFAGGADPVLPTPFRIGAAGAAAHVRVRIDFFGDLTHRVQGATGLVQGL